MVFYNGVLVLNLINIRNLLFMLFLSLFFLQFCHDISHFGRFIHTFLHAANQYLPVLKLSLLFKTPSKLLSATIPNNPTLCKILHSSLPPSVIASHRRTNQQRRDSPEYNKKVRMASSFRCQWIFCLEFKSIVSLQFHIFFCHILCRGPPISNRYCHQRNKYFCLNELPVDQAKWCQ